MLSKDRNGQLRSAVLRAYGGDPPRCKLCGSERYLQLDHIDGDGAEQRARFNMFGYRLYRYLIREGFPSGYRILCASCNLKQRKPYTYGPYPTVSELSDLANDR
jgi:hypothetical protein